MSQEFSVLVVSLLRIDLWFENGFTCDALVSFNVFGVLRKFGLLQAWGLARPSETITSTAASLKRLLRARSVK